MAINPYSSTTIQIKDIYGRFDQEMSVCGTTTIGDVKKYIIDQICEVPERYGSKNPELTRLLENAGAQRYLIKNLHLTFMGIELPDSMLVSNYKDDIFQQLGVSLPYPTKKLDPEIEVEIIRNKINNPGNAASGMFYKNSSQPFVQPQTFNNQSTSDAIINIPKVM